MNKYKFKPYNTNFPNLFSHEKSRISDSIKECLDIQHVGSTAVPGLGGKGIIDIIVAVKKENIEIVSMKLQDLSYVLREAWSTPERLFFRIDLPDEEESTRRYHVHLTFLESTEWKSLIEFRNYLKSHPEAIEEYAHLKKQASESNKEGAEYRQIKDPFFEKISQKIKEQ